LAGTVPSEKISRNILSILKPNLKKGIDISYFFSFDNSWKVDSKEDIGSYWGIWDKDEQLKFGE
jgi:exo-beta-1,3-glucanase (GH17 family)